MISKLIDQSKTEDLLFLSGIILNYLNTENSDNKKKYSILPELFSTLGIDTTINLIKYFGGESIKIPSHEEMVQSFLIIICYYKKKIENKDWLQIKEEINMDISPHTLGKIIERIDEKLKIDINDLNSFGIEDYIKKISKVVNK